MIGDAPAPEGRGGRTLGDVALELRGLSVFDARGRQRVAGLDLAVRKGEIVGLFGLLGAGCIEAALAVYGAWTGRREGAILVDGAPAAIGGPDAAVALGLGLMAQDRRDCLIGEQSVADNIGIASLGRIAPHGHPRRRGRPAAGARPGRGAEHQGRVDRRRGRARSPAATSRRCRSPAGWPPRAAS